MVGTVDTAPLASPSRSVARGVSATGACGVGGSLARGVAGAAGTGGTMLPRAPRMSAALMAAPVPAGAVLPTLPSAPPCTGSKRLPSSICANMAPIGVRITISGTWRMRSGMLLPRRNWVASSVK